jgi:pimeloyl-ACP methyl ester carboxylesterase
MNQTDMDTAPEWFRRALAMRPDRESLNVKECEIAYSRWGDRATPPVILVHGRSANSRWWDHIAPFLASEFSVMAVDLSGHGDSGWRSSYAWSLWAEEIRALATAGACAAPVVVAHSLGGRVAALAASRMRHSIAGLVVVDSAIPLSVPAGNVTAGVSMKFPVKNQSAPRKAYASIGEAIGHFRLHDAPTDDALPYVLRHIAEASLKEVDDGFAWKRDASSAHRTDARPGPEALTSIQCPIAWICAEHGKVTADLRAGYPRLIGRPVPIIEIPGAYHHIMLDQPLSLVTAIRSILAAWNHAAA